MHRRKPSQGRRNPDRRPRYPIQRELEVGLGEIGKMYPDHGEEDTRRTEGKLSWWDSTVVLRDLQFLDGGI